ncbi:MAG: TolC family protein [Bacteroidales bacterium]|jgi:cobalt-zinc-cadmium efflux system outer membrane protein|nr:TolC family protein [Bacteroidales bacterium]
MNRYIVILLTMLLYSSLSFSQTLDTYFTIAAENNPGLQAAYAEYEAALQKVPQVSTLPDPTFSFGYFLSPAETRVGAQQAKFSLTQMFPWFGTLKAQGDVATLQAEAKFHSFINARNKLYLQVASAYFPLYELQEWIRIEHENISILESYKTIATQNFENGKGTMVDVLRVDIMLKDAQTNLSILMNKKKPLQTAFNNLLNRDKDENVVINNSLTTETLPDNFRKDSLIAANPKLQALDLQLQSHEAAEILAQKKGMPKFGVGLDYVIVAERTDVSVPENGKDIFMPMVSVSIPIFRNKYKASVKEAQLMQESYKHQKQEVTNSLVSEYEMLWFQIQQQLELLSLYEQQIQTSQQSLNLLFTSYSNSGEEFEEILRMQQQLLKYQKMKATALSQFKIAIAKINYVTSKTY